MPDASQKAVKQTGTLILVAGPSGAGKDTLIDAARDAFGEDGAVHFPKRLITRDDTTGEEHIPVSPGEFQVLLDEDALFLHWEAHGLQYGVAREVLDHLESGKVVILNISRRLVAAAREKWANTRLVQVVVDDEVLLQRLKARGREDEEAIRARFARRREPVTEDADYIVDNSGLPETAIGVFTDLVGRYL